MADYTHKQNLHTHCTWDDGQSSIDELAVFALKAGMTSLGVSIHTPMPFGVQSCAQEKLPAFLDAVHTAKEKYAALGLRIYAGAEWDILSTIPHDRQNDLVSLASFDYVIGSVHYITVSNPEAESVIRAGGFHPSLAEQFRYRHFPVDESYQSSKHMVNGYFKGNADKAVRYYYAQYDAIAHNPYVQIVGHFDLPLKFCTQYGFLDREYHVFDENSEAFRKAMDDAMALLVKAGKIFEVNTRTMLSTFPIVSQYRSWEWLRRLREMGGKITVSSDAHHAPDVGHIFPTAVDLIRNSGFDEIMVLHETEKNGKIILEFVPEKIT